METHLFGMRANIRGREIEIFFVKKLRSERRFASVAVLKGQINKDIKLAKKITKNFLYKESDSLIMPCNKNK